MIPNAIKKVSSVLVDWPARILSPLADLLAAGMRIHVGWQFFKAGMIKIQSWPSTLNLFESTYEVPLLAPYPAAVLGTAGELVFPLLIWAGLATRLASIGLQIVNVVAMFSVLHFFDAGFSDPAYADHYLWGLMLLALTVYGGGRLSVDHLLGRFAAKRA